MTRDDLKNLGVEYVDINSWNGDEPNNWEEIAEKLNKIIDREVLRIIEGIDDEYDQKAVIRESDIENRVWEKYYC